MSSLPWFAVAWWPSAIKAPGKVTHIANLLKLKIALKSGDFMLRPFTSLTSNTF